jgi:hypothetical protein
VVDDPRFVTEVNPKTGDLSVRDTHTGELLDIVDCARVLNVHQMVVLDTGIATE